MLNITVKIHNQGFHKIFEVITIRSAIRCSRKKISIHLQISLPHQSLPCSTQNEIISGSNQKQQYKLIFTHSGVF